MKFLILFFALTTVAYAQQEKTAAILRQSSDISPDGAYNYEYQTDNGISGAESGALGPVNSEGHQAVVSQGQYSYTSPDGTPINVVYTANENGFQPQGDHIPTPPPLPPQIQRALEWIAAHPIKPEIQQPHYNQYHH